MKILFHQSGRSMVEMLGVLAIIGVLSVAGIAGYSKAMAHRNLNKTIDQAQMIISNFMYYVQNTNNKSGMYNTNVINSLIIPQEMLDSSNQCHHALGGRCLVSQNTNGSQEFIVRFGDLDKEACIQLLILPYSEYAQKVSVNKIAQGTPLSSGNGKVKTGAISIRDAASLCYDKQNAVRWHF